MKFDDRKIRFLCMHIVKMEDKTVGLIAAQCGVSKRRVRQSAKHHQDIGDVQLISRRHRSRSRFLMLKERRLVNII